MPGSAGARDIRGPEGKAMGNEKQTVPAAVVTGKVDAGGVGGSRDWSSVAVLAAREAA